MNNYFLIVIIIMFSLIISGCIVINQGIQNNIDSQASTPPQPTPEIIYITVTPTPTPLPLPISSGTNSITGRVYDANHNTVPNAKITLYYTKFITNDYVVGNPVKMSDNPQFTGDGSRSLTGLYKFSGLTSDVYIITTEKNGITYSEKIQVLDGTKTADITIAGYIEKSF
jgi:hypothetical protein